jgi:hypothetical protein
MFYHIGVDYIKAPCGRKQHYDTNSSIEDKTGEGKQEDEAETSKCTETLDVDTFDSMNEEYLEKYSHGDEDEECSCDDVISE